MHTPDLFLTRASECESMAKLAREPDSKAIWTRMAERWHRCAERETNASLTAHRSSEANQRPRHVPGWARH
jgi:hypothetical protein